MGLPSERIGVVYKSSGGVFLVFLAICSDAMQYRLTISLRI